MKAITLWQPWASLCVIPRPCAVCGGRGWHTAGGNDPMDCGRCDGGERVAPFKTIETRSWKAPDSLIGQRIAIHAAARRPERGQMFGEWSTGLLVTQDDEGWLLTDNATDELHGLPLGAIVGTAVLAACVPMVHTTQPREGHCLVVGPSGMMLHGDPGEPGVDVSDQRPFGIFEPGRWAWLLERPVRFETPIPVRGRQRVWNLPDELDYLAARGAVRS